MDAKDKILQEQVINDFGDEWERFSQETLAPEELKRMFDGYFSLFPWQNLPETAQGFDMGCGTGRWACLAAGRVGTLHCVEPSKKALAVAKTKLAKFSNVQFHNVRADQLPFADDSMDFAYSLGVLHHIPDTQQAIKDCVQKLKQDAPLLLYLYYRFDNKPWWFRSIWKVSDYLRRGTCKLPRRWKYLASQVIAAFIYFPLARFAKLLEKFGVKVDNWPLSSYRENSYYTMRTDALDRFGTRLEQRFTQVEIEKMMQKAGLTDIRFREGLPYWCVIGYKR